MKIHNKTAGAMFSLDEQDIRKIIDAAENIRDRLIIELLAFTGCRRAELVLIRISDVNLDEEKIFIPTVKRRDNPYDCLRVVPIINTRLKQDLQVYLQLWVEKYRLKKSDKLIQQEQKRKKDGLSVVRINQIVGSVAKKAGVISPNPKRRHLNPHILRHSFVRHCSTLWLGL